MIIINISGKAGSGKDTLAKEIKIYLDKLGLRTGICKYGDFVKLMYSSFNEYTGKKDKKERRGLQRIGHGIKQVDDPLYWVKQVDNQIKAYNKLEQVDVVLIPDCRYPEEIEYWENQVSIRLINPSYRKNDTGMDEMTKAHHSETALDEYKDFDFVEYVPYGLHNLTNLAFNLAKKIFDYFMTEDFVS